MTPYYDDGQVAIYHGDCRELLPALREPIDLVLTDPPYGMSYVTSHRVRGDDLRKPLEGDADLNALRDALPHLDRLLKADRHAYVFAGASMIGATEEAVAATWNVKNLLVWDKGDAGSVGDLEAGFAVTFEAIVYATKGRRALRGPRPRSIYRYDWSGKRDPVHPTVKPVGLLAWLIGKSTDAGEVVLDPFMGSGTTLRAAKDLGRRAIGIELEERYCEAAVKRLRQEVLDLGGVA